MRYSSVSFILAIAIAMQRLQVGLLVTISFDSEDLAEKSGLSFEEPMDSCDDPNYQNVVRLNRMSLTILPTDFVKSPDIRFITLEDNKISQITGDAFRSVPYLTCLNIRNNQINVHGLRNFRHDNLTKLNFANNKIAFISDKNWDVFLPLLTHLDLSGNQIIYLPKKEDFQSSIPNLTHLYISNNLLYSNFYSNLPSSTRHIYLGKNMYGLPINRLPHNLYAVYINENTIGEIYSDKLFYIKIISIRNCVFINQFFYILEKAPNVVDLDLSSNDLRLIPRNALVNMNSLQRLYLENNTLSDFPIVNEFNLLTDLSLNFNNITYITDESVANYEYLKRLYLRGNRISMIEENALLKLKNLEILDLAENQLTRLPPKWILPLTALSHLDLRSNRFDTIDDMSVDVYLKSLKDLYLGKNNFTQIVISSVKRINGIVTIYVN